MGTLLVFFTSNSQRFREFESALSAKESADVGSSPGHFADAPDAANFITARLISSTIKNAYNRFPDPLSPTQMSALADRLRDEGPQKVMIVRKDDRQSIALADQFREIFESAHWVLITPPRPPNNGVILFRGLVIWRAPSDYQPLDAARATSANGHLDVLPQPGAAGQGVRIDQQGLRPV